MNEEAITVSNLAYSYGKIKAVDGISFDAAPGEVLGFLGPNGAGKSTTIKMLIGMLEPQAGQIRLLGEEMPDGRDRIQPRIGVCFEEKNLYVEMSARENLEFFARLFGIRRYDADAALARVGLTGREDQRVKGYSKGMRQRLMVARSLINRPNLLFLDEPTDGLDPVSSRSIRSIVEEEADRGAAVILTTHDMHEADRLSDRVAFINEGKVVALDTPENLKLQYGERSVRIRLKENGEVEERLVSLDQADTGERLKQAVTSPGLLTIHTEEATLEDIFIRLTGRRLAS